MGERLGVIAGSGPFARQALGLARERGYAPVVAAIRGEASDDLMPAAEAFEWIGLTEIEKLDSFFKSRGVREVVFVGKVDPAVLARRDRGDAALSAFLMPVRDATPTAVLESLIALLNARGFSVKDPGFLLEPYLRAPGLLGRIEPSPVAAADIDFGWPLALALADLEIGQTIAVKGRAVVAAEGMDGTDETILRAGRIAGPGCTVVKRARTRQDLRIDAPGVGLETVRACIRSRAAALCIEAGRVAFFQLADAAALADDNGLALIVKEGSLSHG
jgi:hypothetical protein